MRGFWEGGHLWNKARMLRTKDEVLLEQSSFSNGLRIPERCHPERSDPL